MEDRVLSDAECVIIIEEEKRLCEENIQFLKGYIKKGISLKNGEIAITDKDVPSIKLERKIIHKDIYRDTDIQSLWKLVGNKDESELHAFLMLDFLNSNVPALHFCFDMSTKLKRSGDVERINVGGVEFIKTFMEFEGNTGNILQWMKLLISSGGEISISDGEEPSIGAGGIPLDIPKIILRFFDEIIVTGGKSLGDKFKISVIDKELKYDR